MKKRIAIISIAIAIAFSAKQNVLANELFADEIVSEVIDLEEIDQIDIAEDQLEEIVTFEEESEDSIEVISNDTYADTALLEEVISNDTVSDYFSNDSVSSDETSSNEDEVYEVITDSSGSRTFYVCDPYENAPYRLIYNIINNDEVSIYGFVSSIEDMYENGYQKGRRTADIIIPESICGKPVTDIHQWAFITSFTDSLRFDFIVNDIVIPSTVKTIGANAFRSINYYSHYVINNLVIPEGVEEIGDYAFDGTIIAKLSLPSTLKRIGNNAFAASLECCGSLIIPEGVEEIGNFAFYGFNGTNIVIPSTVKVIGNDAFSYITSEEEAKIEDLILKGSYPRGELKRRYVNYRVSSITNNSIVPFHLPGMGALLWLSEDGESILSVSDGHTATKSNNNYVYEMPEENLIVSQTINLDEIFMGYIGSSPYPVKYRVDDKKLASISKNKLKGSKAGTVKVTAEVRDDVSCPYEDAACCIITILPKPYLRFKNVLTYPGQELNCDECLVTPDYDNSQYSIAYWGSSNTKVAEVSDTGIVTVKKEGTVRIYCYFENEGKTNKISINNTLTIKFPKFQKASYTFKTGEKAILAMKNVTASSNPEWIADDSNVNIYPQLDKNGNMTGKVVVESLSCGTTTLRATIDDQEYTCEINVVAPKINKTKLTIKKNRTSSVSLSNTKIKKTDIKWYSSDETIATVDANGKIKAVSEGEATIYTEAGGFRNECLVTIK